MSPARPGRKADGALAGAGVLMILCCVVGPAAIGVAAGSAIGGWPGILGAVLLAGLVALHLHRRRGRDGC